MRQKQAISDKKWSPKIAVNVIKDQLLLQSLLPFRDNPQVEIHCQGGNLKSRMTHLIYLHFFSLQYLIRSYHFASED